MLMGDILRRSAINFPNKTALIYENYALSYRELNYRVNCLANSLLKMGIKKGDRLALLLHNCPELFEIYFASAKIGSIFVPINNLIKQKELRQILEYVSPRVLFVDPDYVEVIDSLREDLRFIEFFIGLKGVSSTNFKQYDFMIEQGESGEPEANVSNDDVMNIILTSGTTGRPKGVMRTHRHNFINVMAEAIEFRLKYDDRALFLTPYYHVAIESVLGRHILMANTIVIRKEGRFDPKETLGILSLEKITVLQVVPTIINAMLQVESMETYDLSHLRLMTYVGSPMPVPLIKRAIKRFNCQFLQLYGQTEAGPMITALRPEDHTLDESDTQLTRLASAGRPVLGWEVRIVDEKDNDVPEGEVGEIIARSDCMTIGYWNLPDETATTLRGGWLHTGDMGRFDGDGYIYIVDRKNDMIISGGKNIYPREIEEVLYQHDAVLEATVIGVPDEYWGESVKALVVLKDGMKATEEEIIDFCKKNLASYKKPRTVEFREELPKNPAGKILKRIIKEEYWKDKGRKI